MFNLEVEVKVKDPFLKKHQQLSIKCPHLVSTGYATNKRPTYIS